MEASIVQSATMYGLFFEWRRYWVRACVNARGVIASVDVGRRGGSRVFSRVNGGSRESFQRAWRTSDEF